MRATEKAERLRAILVRVQTHRYHAPDSDFMEYCNGCGRSPYNRPPHKPDCLVPAIRKVLEETA